MTTAKTIWLAYRDIEDYEPRGSFEILASPATEGLLVKDTVIPGEFGLKEVHIKWHSTRIEGVEVRLVTYTHEAVPPGRARRLLKAAYNFAQRRN